MTRFLFSMLLLFGLSVLGLSQEKKELTKEEHLEKIRAEIQKILDTGDLEKLQDLEKFRLKSRDIFGELPGLFEHHRKRMFDGISKSKTITLYEGLPHQKDEVDVYKKELVDKKTIKLNDYDFYADPITLKEKDAQTLLKLCQTEKFFTRYIGPKLCGGYHPDWCIEFKNGDEVYRFNLCSGCGDARIYGPKSEVYTELEGAGDLWELLETYRKNRPKKEE